MACQNNLTFGQIARRRVGQASNAAWYLGAFLVPPPARLGRLPSRARWQWRPGRPGWVRRWSSWRLQGKRRRGHGLDQHFLTAAPSGHRGKFPGWRGTARIARREHDLLAVEAELDRVEHVQRVVEVHATLGDDAPPRLGGAFGLQAELEPVQVDVGGVPVRHRLHAAFVRLHVLVVRTGWQLYVDRSGSQ